MPTCSSSTLSSATATSPSRSSSVLAPVLLLTAPRSPDVSLLLRLQLLRQRQQPLERAPPRPTTRTRRTTSSAGGIRSVSAQRCVPKTGRHARLPRPCPRRLHRPTRLALAQHAQRRRLARELLADEEHLDVLVRPLLLPEQLEERGDDIGVFEVRRGHGRGGRLPQHLTVAVELEFPQRPLERDDAGVHGDGVLVVAERSSASGCTSTRRRRAPFEAYGGGRASRAAPVGRCLWGTWPPRRRRLGRCCCTSRAPPARSWYRARRRAPPPQRRRRPCCSSC